MSDEERLKEIKEEYKKEPMPPHPIGYDKNRATNKFLLDLVERLEFELKEERTAYGMEAHEILNKVQEGTMSKMRANQRLDKFFKIKYQSQLKKYKDAVEKVDDKIIQKIIEDISDRRGLRQAWESIDDEIQQEIKDVWKNVIQQALEKLKEE